MTWAGLSPPYDVVYADPPWAFAGNSAAKPERNASRHYGTMSLQEIAALPVRDLVGREAALFMWITGPFLVAGAHIPIMKAWGFKPTALGFTWIKLRRGCTDRTLFGWQAADLHLGLGLTTRKNAEFCVLGKRGRSLRAHNGVPEVGVFPAMEHSRKPAQFRERIETYVGPGRRMVELFARETAPGWDTWGDEVGKFDAVAA